MGSTPGQIENYIDDKRQDLGANLHELEDRVKSATDWRQQFENHPGIFLGVALGGGVLLGALVGGSNLGRRSGSKYSKTSESQNYAPQSSSPAMAKMTSAWENAKGALVGLAITRFKEYADEIVPGFNEHFQKAAGEGSR